MTSADEQHTTLELAMEAVELASTGEDVPLEHRRLPGQENQARYEATRAALRNQEVQALTAIALELRELRQASKRFKWMRSDRVEGSPHGTARDSADAQFDD